jgi:hypothetical protein
MTLLIYYIMPSLPEELIYSDKYNDGNYEYRNVMLTKECYKKIRGYFDDNKLIPENVWRNILNI